MHSEVIFNSILDNSDENITASFRTRLLPPLYVEMKAPFTADRIDQMRLYPLGVLKVPEAPSAVLALVPDPAGQARAAARHGVTLSVHAGFVAFLRLGGARQPGEQHGGGQQDPGGEHQPAARAGPPRRSVHSL